MCALFQSCFMEPRHGHSPPCLRRSLMHVTSDVWEGFYTSHTSSTSLTLKCWCEPTRHSSLQFCATDVYGSSDMLPGLMRGWTTREHCVQVFQGYRITGGVLSTDPDSPRRKPLKKIWVHALSIGLHTAWRRSQDREQWQRTVEVAMLHYGACSWWWWWCRAAGRLSTETVQRPRSSASRSWFELWTLVVGRSRRTYPIFICHHLK